MNILVLGREWEIAEAVVRLLEQQPGWTASAALDDDEAIQRFMSGSFDLVLVGGGVSADSERSLAEKFRTKNPAIKIIQHFGGGSGLLFNEIQEALRKTP